MNEFRAPTLLIKHKSSLITIAPDGLPSYTFLEADYHRDKIIHKEHKKKGGNTLAF